MGIRDYVTNSPPDGISLRWLLAKVGVRTMYVPGLGVDANCEKMNQAMRLHLPGYGDPSGLPYIGADRLIVRGLIESDDSYAHRLQLAWDDWGFAGAPRTDLRETLAYVLPMTPAGETVSDEGLWNVYLPGDDTSQEPSHFRASPTNWDWDSLNIGGGFDWWRCYLILFSVAPNDFVTKSGKWGASGKKWGDKTKCWGLQNPVGVMRGIRAILAQWEGEHAYFQWIIVSFDASLFQMHGPSGSDPDGQWGRWGKYSGGAYIPSRSSNARYASGPQ